MPIDTTKKIKSVIYNSVEIPLVGSGGGNMPELGHETGYYGISYAVNTQAVPNRSEANGYVNE